MGNVADKVPPHLFKLIQPGDILGHDQAVIVAEQADLDLQMDVGLGWRVDFQGLAVIPGIEIGLECRVADQVMDVLTLIGAAAETQQVFGRAVLPLHGATGIGHDNAVAHGVGGFLNPVDTGP